MSTKPIPFAKAILSLAEKYKPVDRSWKSKELQDALAKGQYESGHGIKLGKASPGFAKALKLAVKTRGFHHAEVRVLLAIALESQVPFLPGWLESNLKEDGEWIGAIGDLIEETWLAKGEESQCLQCIVFVVLSLKFDHGGEWDKMPMAMVRFILRWPDHLFLALFSEQLAHGSTEWYRAFILGGQAARLAHILQAVQERGPEVVAKLSAPHIYLLRMDEANFAPLVAAMVTAYQATGNPTRALDCLIRLMSRKPEACTDEMTEAAVAVLAYAGKRPLFNGEDHFRDASQVLLQMRKELAMPAIQRWFDTPLGEESTKWCDTRGKGLERVTAYFSAAIHVGPPALPLLERILAKGDGDAVSASLGCWNQFRHQPTASLLVEHFARIATEASATDYNRVFVLQQADEWLVQPLRSTLVACFHDSSKKVRETAARMLGRFGNDCLALALDDLRSPKAERRLAAVILLEAIGSHEVWEPLSRACFEEKSGAVCGEMRMALGCLAIGLGREIDKSILQHKAAQWPRSPLSCLRYDKVPKLVCNNGETLRSEALQSLLYDQWRAGGDDISAAADVARRQLTPESQDLLARHLVGFDVPYHITPEWWLYPLIAHMAGPQTLNARTTVGPAPFHHDLIAETEAFLGSNISYALALVRLLNTNGSAEAHDILAKLRQDHSRFSHLPWPCFEGHDFFDAKFPSGNPL